MKTEIVGFITVVVDIGWSFRTIPQVTTAELLITIIREQVRGLTQAELQQLRRRVFRNRLINHRLNQTQQVRENLLARAIAQNLLLQEKCLALVLVHLLVLNFF